MGEAEAGEDAVVQAGEGRLAGIAVAVLAEGEEEVEVVAGDSTCEKEEEEGQQRPPSASRMVVEWEGMAGRRS